MCLLLKIIMLLELLFHSNHNRYLINTYYPTYIKTTNSSILD